MVSASSHFTCGRPIFNRLLARRPEGVFVNSFERGEIGPDLFRAACQMGLQGLCTLAARPTTHELMLPADYLFAAAEEAKAFLTAADSFAQLQDKDPPSQSFRTLDAWTFSRKRDFWR